MRNGKYTDTTASWSSKKGIIAIVLFGTAALFGLYQYERMHPPLTYTPPKSEQMEREKLKGIKEEFNKGFEKLGLTEEQKEKLRNWEKWSGKGKTQEERKTHKEELKKILNDEQINYLKKLQSIQKDKMQEVRKEQKERLIKMIGEEEYKKFREDMKKSQQNRANRKKEQTKSSDTTTTQTFQQR